MPRQLITPKFAAPFVDVMLASLAGRGCGKQNKAPGVPAQRVDKSARRFRLDVLGDLKGLNKVELAANIKPDIKISRCETCFRNFQSIAVNVISVNAKKILYPLLRPCPQPGA